MKMLKTDVIIFAVTWISWQIFFAYLRSVILSVAICQGWFLVVIRSSCPYYCAFCCCFEFDSENRVWTLDESRSLWLSNWKDYMFVLQINDDILTVRWWCLMQQYQRGSGVRLWSSCLSSCKVLPASYHPSAKKVIPFTFLCCQLSVNYQSRPIRHSVF